MLSTTHLIGKNLDEADALLKTDSMSNTNRLISKWGNNRGGDTLSNAAKNVLAGEKELYGYSNYERGQKGGNGGMIGGDQLRKID